MSDYSPLPWRIDDSLGDEAIYIKDADGDALAEAWPEGRADHELIVEAVNSHHQLKKRVQELEEVLEKIVDMHGLHNSHRAQTLSLDVPLVARAALHSKP